ncbi:DUF2383 domain-containing protein [Flavivirga rizhaonensis]|uniref:DUF2383 domain-containing protein n=1 Tax=Flavivirga rizhaonensis TaxID=2559571 RepID=A0A4S1DXD7_9FLAO|nr:DUF2383 domain-containing protein [Flavivirga rizhaonensis]TGV02826.1 DUF2383 domain-containing protein [Flavivirga rizhaonensis]
MKKENKILVKLNDIFLMNKVIEKTYIKTYEKVSDINIKALLKEKSLERYNFSEILQNEIKKLGADVEESIMSKRRYHFYMRSFSNLLQLEDNIGLLNAVYKIELLCIEKYNELLQEINLSLSLCRLLVKQRDHIQYGLRLIKKELDFVD